VILATGANGAPRVPQWPGIERFPGEVLHSSAYRSGRDFAGQRVLVVGFGNSGGEIALDLSEHGARPAVSVRSAVNVVPRDVAGVPALAIAIPLSKLPPRLADALVWPVLKACYPSYRRIGLRKSRLGPFRQIARENRIPLLDVGTTEAIRRGAIDVVGEVEAVEGPECVFADGSRRVFDAIVMATGYLPAQPEIRGGAYAGSPIAGEGLYFCGFFVSPRGMLREIGREAVAIANDLAEHFP
jgi:cation diffusion facilitator CzcD-associated flavoprotein CzcO